MASNKSILKATGLIGGSSILGMIFTLIRSKAIAMLLGPSGTGFIGALESSTSLVQGLAGLGIQNSAVRDIAKAHANEQPEVLSKTIRSLRRIVLLTGVLGMLLTLLLAEPLSDFTFSTDEYTWHIRLLSVAVFFNLIVAGQSALIQGMRRIRDLATMSIVGAGLSTLLSVPLIYWFGLNGVATYIVVLSIGQYLVSWHFANKIKTLPISLTWIEVHMNFKSMVGLGVAFMGGAMTTLGTSYLIRVLLIREFTLSGAGLYQAAIAISGLYINIVIQSMGKDFFPRLAAVANDSKKEIQLINEQIEIGVWLAAPGLLITLALAPMAINLLYTVEYIQSYRILQWMILGIFLRTVTWPMGYLFVARARKKIFFATQLFANILHLSLLLIGISVFGLEGSGIAFFVLYFIHMLLIYALVHRENEYKFTKANISVLAKLLVVFILSFLLLNFTEQWIGSSVVSLLAIILGYFTFRKIMVILEVEDLSQLLKLIRSFFGR